MATEASTLPQAEHTHESLLVQLSSEDWQVRTQAVLAVAGLLRGRPEGERAEALEARLLELSEDPQWQVREEVAAALEAHASEDAEERLEALCEDATTAVSRAAKHALKERRRLQRLEEREGKRVARVMQRIKRLQQGCSFDVAREIEEVGIAYHHQIAFGCSHDVLNLMRSIQFSLRELGQELARRRVPRKVWEETLDRAQRRAEVTKGIAMSMRSLARQEVPAVRRIALLRAVDEAVGVVRDRFGQRGHGAAVEVIVRVPKHLRVEVPRDRLLQALINLMQNSFEAIREDGVVWIEAELEDDEVVLTIADTGRGIRPAVQEVVFFPGKSTKKGKPGHEHNTGWGLSLARKFIEEDCRGELRLSSEYGKGTTVVLRLPLRRPEEDQ